MLYVYMLEFSVYFITESVFPSFKIFPFFLLFISFSGYYSFLYLYNLLFLVIYSNGIMEVCILILEYFN